MKNLLKNWNIARIIRLLAGVGFGIYALIENEYLLLILAALLLLQAVLNVSCCGCGTGTGAGACPIPSQTDAKSDSEPKSASASASGGEAAPGSKPHFENEIETYRKQH